jgi:ABC-type phosphate transport system auxiliary subunit
MRANLQRMQDEMLRMFGPKLKKIRNEKERNREESKLLWDAGVAAEVELGELKAQIKILISQIQMLRSEFKELKEKKDGKY